MLDQHDAQASELDSKFTGLRVVPDRLSPAARLNAGRLGRKLAESRLGVRWRLGSHAWLSYTGEVHTDRIIDADIPPSKKSLPP